MSKKSKQLAKIFIIIICLFGLSYTNLYSNDTNNSTIVNSKYFKGYLDNPALLEITERVISITREKLLSKLNDSLRYKPEIHIVGSPDEFKQLIKYKFPDWGAAVAIPAEELIVIKSPQKFNVNKSLPELLSHEYTHLLVSQKAGLFEPPRWLNEGLAMYFSSEWSWSNNLALSKAAVFGQFIPLNEIEQLNRFNEGKAQVAYAQSYIAVEYLIDNYSSDVLEKFLIQIASGLVIDNALYNVTGLTYNEFNADFNIYLNQRFNILSLFMDTIILWLFLAMVVIVAFFLRFKKRRSYYKKWDEEEKLHSTDFDYGDSTRPEQSDEDDEPWRS